jgi:hypothetical protein
VGHIYPAGHESVKLHGYVLIMLSLCSLCYRLDDQRTGTYILWKEFFFLFEMFSPPPLLVEPLVQSVPVTSPRRMALCLFHNPNFKFACALSSDDCSAGSSEVTGASSGDNILNLNKIPTHLKLKV